MDMIRGRIWTAAVAAWLAITAAAPARAQAPTTLSDSPALGSTITVNALGELPANSNLLSLLDAAQADLISDRIDTGGLSTGEPTRLGANGSSWTQTHFRVGDVSITDPEGSGAPLLLPNLAAWDRLDVSTGLVPIEMNAPGLAITLVPRRPSATWTRAIEGIFSGPALLARTFTTTPPAIAHLNTFGYGSLFASGPLIPGRLGLALASDWTRSSRFERGDPTLLSANVGSMFAHLELTPNARDRVGMVAWLQTTESPLTNRLAFGEPSAAESKLGVHMQSRWERLLASGLSWTLSAGFASRSRSHDDMRATTIAIERLTDGPVPAALNPQGTASSWSIAARIGSPAAAPVGGGHAVRLGFEASGASARTQAGFSGLIGELVDGLPARVWQYKNTGRDSEWNEKGLVIYVSDRVELLPRVLLEAGIRFESIGGSAAGGVNPIRWNNWLPRGSIRWELTNVFNIATFAGFGRYGYELPLQYFAFGDPAAPTGSVYRWNAAGGGPPLANQIGDLVARVGPGTDGAADFSTIDPNLSRPFMDELVIGFESRPRPSAVVRLTAMARREQRLVGLVNVGVPATSYSVVSVPDPGLDLFSDTDDQLLPVYNRSRASFGADRYLLTNPTDNDATFVGVSMTGQTSVRNLFLLAGATAGRSEGFSANRGFQAIENDHGLIGELFTNPNALTHARGRLFTERGYTIKFASVYRFPQDVRFGVLARYQDGQHFARLVLVDGLNQGREAVRAFRNGRTRFTYSMTVDARLQKGFTFGNSRIDAILDAYNLLNTATEIEEFAVTGPTSRLTAAVQPPRAIHIGLRVTF